MAQNQLMLHIKPAGLWAQQVHGRHYVHALFDLTMSIAHGVHYGLLTLHLALKFCVYLLL